jgi:murein DD-endopeptidase MepM/ murein hydrolase activator NlpD
MKLPSLVSALLLFVLGTGWAEPKVTSETTEGKTVITVVNPNLCPETVTFRATLTNITPSRKLPFTVEIPPGATEELCTFTPTDPEKKDSWRYNWNSQMGSAKAKHDDTYIYTLPYPKGKTFKVMQGYLGAFSHNGEFQYAIDWSMPVGSEVCAARDGLVVKTTADNDKGGPTKDFKKFANVLMVQHDDGTLAEYVHLKKDGILVKVGDQVKTGQVVALSGNTGFSSGPHLHFHVYQPVDGTKFRTLPVKFRTASQKIVPLMEGKRYTAP